MCLHSEDGEEPELNSHESALVKTMIKGPAATQGKRHVVIIVHLRYQHILNGFPFIFSYSYTVKKSTGYDYCQVSFLHPV